MLFEKKLKYSLEGKNAFIKYKTSKTGLTTNNGISDTEFIKFLFDSFVLINIKKKTTPKSLKK